MAGWSKRPPAMFCRECGAPMGRGWTEAPLCDNCNTTGVSNCSCSFPKWDPECEVHERDPYDIPF